MPHMSTANLTESLNSPVFLGAWGKPLLILHSLMAILLLGAMTHNVLLTVPYLWKRYKKVRLEKLYVKVIFVAYSLTFALGAVVYPNYRYHVRDLYFDKHMPWASHLFDIKEHWAAIGLGLVGVFFLLSLSFDPRQDRERVLLYVFLSCAITLTVWFNLIAGLWLTALKGVV